MIVNNFRKTLEICPWVPFLLSQGMSRVTFVTDPQEKQVAAARPLAAAAVRSLSSKCRASFTSGQLTVSSCQTLL